MRNNLQERRPNVNARTRYQPQQPKVTVKPINPSAKALKYMADDARSNVFKQIIQGIFILIGSVVLGYATTMLFFAFAYLFTSALGKALGELITGVFIGYAQGFLPTYLAAYAPWLLFGVPAFVIGLQVAYALATNTHGFSSNARSWLKFGIHAFFYALPFVAFIGGLMIGYPVQPLLWITWGLNTFTSVYMMWIHQNVVNGYFAELDKKDQQAAQQTQGPNQQGPNLGDLPNIHQNLVDVLNQDQQPQPPLGRRPPNFLPSRFNQMPENPRVPPVQTQTQAPAPAPEETQTERQRVR